MELAKKVDGETVLLTFHPHPRLVLFPDDSGLKVLSTQEEKIERLALAGLDHLVIYPFTQKFSRLSSVEYVRELLVNSIGVHTLVSGYDHHFGRNREGDLERMRELAELYQFQVVEIPAQTIDEVNVSSTKVRNALRAGDVARAARYLGYNYGLSGKVVKGESLGRSIGFPTANIQVENELKLVPGNGVYAIRAELRKKQYEGMMNIGHRPTVNSKPGAAVLEAHLFEMNEEFYDETLTVQFVARLRDEVRFADTEALKTQLSKDRVHALELLG